MALTKCQGCGTYFSNAVGQCPKCGRPIDASPAIRGWIKTLAWAGLATVTAYYFHEFNGFWPWEFWKY